MNGVVRSDAPEIAPAHAGRFSGASLRPLPWLLIAAYLLFAHGCHSGDHDDELMIRPPISAAKQTDN
jgi:hypothetical protein